MSHISTLMQEVNLDTQMSLAGKKREKKLYTIFSRKRNEKNLDLCETVGGQIHFFHPWSTALFAIKKTLNPRSLHMSRGIAFLNSPINSAAVSRYSHYQFFRQFFHIYSGGYTCGANLPWQQGGTRAGAHFTSCRDKASKLGLAQRLTSSASAGSSPCRRHGAAERPPAPPRGGGGKGGRVRGWEMWGGGRKAAAGPLPGWGVPRLELCRTGGRSRLRKSDTAKGSTGLL